MSRDKKAFAEYAKNYLRQRYAERREEAIKILGGHCMMCGSGDHSDIQIDHKNREEKNMTFERMAVVSRKKFLHELAKCQLLCSKCHSEKSTKERGYNSKTDHGTRVCYERSGCRCEACKKAKSEANRIYRLAKKANYIGV